MIPIPGRTDWDGTRCHHFTQNGAQFKMYELLTSAIFHLMFSKHCCLQVTETAESEIMDKGITVGCLRSSNMAISRGQTNIGSFHFLCVSTQLLWVSFLLIWNRLCCPGWCGSVDWVLACEPKGHWFDSQSGHMPGLRARSPAGGVREATIHWWLSPSHSPSLSLKLNK